MSSDEKNISSLYQAADKPAPPQELDQAILAASRKAVEKSRNTAPFTAAWPAWASAAAVIVIAIILVPVLRQQEPPHIIEQTTREPRFADKLADEVPAGLYSVSESEERIKEEALPAAEPSVTVEANTSAGQPSAPALRTNALNKSSIITEREAQSETTVDHKTRSRMQAADSAPFAVLTPEMWEIKIAQLVDDGRIDQARTELDKLKSHFPEHDIDRILLQKLTNHNE